MMRGTTALVRTATRQAAACRRPLSTAPKLHKAKEHWGELKSKRPIDHDDLHVRLTAVGFVLRFGVIKFQIPF
jgi:hypothetical protein